MAPGETRSTRCAGAFVWHNVTRLVTKQTYQAPTWRDASHDIPTAHAYVQLRAHTGTGYVQPSGINMYGTWMPERVQDDLNHRVSARTCAARACVCASVYVCLHGCICTCACACVCMRVRVREWICAPAHVSDVHSRDQAFCALPYATHFATDVIALIYFGSSFLFHNSSPSREKCNGFAKQRQFTVKDLRNYCGCASLLGSVPLTSLYFTIILYNIPFYIYFNYVDAYVDMSMRWHVYARKLQYVNRVSVRVIANIGKISIGRREWMELTRVCFVQTVLFKTEN